MLFYHVLNAVDRAYGIAVLGLYILAFGAAFMLIFVFPPGSLVLLFVGLFGLVVVLPAGRGLHWWTRRVSRHYLLAGRCPICGDPIESEAVIEQRAAWCCSSCDAKYTAAGEWIDPAYRPSPP